MAQHQTSEPLPEFVSRQVTEARRFFLDLNPDRRKALSVVCGGVERMRPEYIVQRQDFSYFAVELVAEGEGGLTINGRDYVLAAGSVFAYGPRAPHTIRNESSNGMKKYYLDFVGSRGYRFLRDAGLLTGRSGFKALVTVGQHELIELFELLIREGMEGGVDAPPICESLVQLILLKIRQRRLATRTSLPPSYATYERIRRHIEQQFLDLHTAQDVAEACGVTPVYLSRLFGRFSDCGAYQYLLRRKMNHAAGLLMSDGLLVKEVAFRLGFPDAFQFSRSFKRVFGVPPTEISRSGM